MTYDRPVIVGAGQFTDRTSDLHDALSPVEMMEKTALEAAGNRKLTMQRILRWKKRLMGKENRNLYPSF